MSTHDDMILEVLKSMRAEFNGRLDTISQQLAELRVEFKGRTGTLEIQQAGTLEMLALRTTQLARQQQAIESIDERVRKLESAQ